MVQYLSISGSRQINCNSMFVALAQLDLYSTEYTYCVCASELSFSISKRIGKKINVMFSANACKHSQFHKWNCCKRHQCLCLESIAAVAAYGNANATVLLYSTLPTLYIFDAIKGKMLTDALRILRAQRWWWSRRLYPSAGVRFGWMVMRATTQFHFIYSSMACVTELSGAYRTKQLICNSH